MMDCTYSAGVTKEVRAVAVSGDVMVWETDFLNPRHDPAHCPPGLVWLHDLTDGRTRRLRLAYRPAPG
jgi:RNA polymerase sigma-70 factor (ECF subfamily)